MRRFDYWWWDKPGKRWLLTSDNLRGRRDFYRYMWRYGLPRIEYTDLASRLLGNKLR